MRWAALALAAAACGRGGGTTGPATEGWKVEHVTRKITHDDGKDEHWLELSYQLVLAKPLGQWEMLQLHTACQVGAYRLVDLSPLELDLGLRDRRRGDHFRVGEPNEMQEQPYLIHPLRAKPTMCDLALERPGPNDTQLEIGRVCTADEIKPGACPPNPAHPPASGPPVTFDELRLERSPANDAFPAALTFDYVITVQAPLAPHQEAHIVAACAGAGDGDVWETDLARLRPGESAFARENLVRGDVPGGTPCDVAVLVTAGPDDRDGALVGRFCAIVDGDVTRGACAR